MNKKLQLLAMGALFGLAGMKAQTVVVSSGNPAKPNVNANIYRKPFASYYGYERAAYIYKQSEIGATGFISQIGFYCDSVNGPATVPVNIYLKEVTNTSFAAATSVATEEAGATLVYSGTIASGTFVKGWINLPLSTLFLHASATSNIEVIVECSGTNTGVEGYLTKGFRCDSLTTTNMQYWQQDNSAPTNTGTLVNYRQNIQLVLTPASACSGTPTGGTASAAATTLCYNDSTSISLSGSTVATGITYQWQSSLNGTTWTNVTNGTGATTAAYSTAPLTVNTYFRNLVTCTNGGASAPSSTVLVNVTTALALPYTEDFESIVNNNDLPNCMQATNLNSETFTYIAPTGFNQQKNHTAGGSKFASFQYNCNDYFFTPALALTAGQTYQFSFWYITDGYTGWNTLSANLGTAPNAAAMTTVIGTSITNPIDTSYKQFTGSFTAPTTGSYNIGIYCNASFSPEYLSIDDINLVQLSACSGTPTSGTVTGNATLCYNDSTNLTLTGSTLATGITYQWQSSPNGSTWTNISGATTSAYNTPRLTVSTYFRAVVTCTVSSASATSASFLVNVTAPAALPYTEDFESIVNDNDLPNCMEATNLNSQTYTYIAPSGFSQQKNHTTGGSKFGSFRYGSNDYFFTPALNLTAGQTYKFSFWYITDGYNGWDTLAAKFGTSASPAAMTGLVGTELHNLTDTVYRKFVGTFVPPTTGVYNIGIYCGASFSPDYLSIDDINLVQLPACTGTPTSGSVTGTASLCYNDSTTLNLVGTSAASGLTSQWQSSPNGTTWTNVTGGSGGTTISYTTPRLTVNTYYRSIITCTASASSATTTAFLVSVAAPLNLPYSEDFESIHTNNQLPGCMEATNLNSETFTYIAPTGSNQQKNHTAGGSKFGSFLYNCDDYFFTPSLNLSAGQSYQLSFWYITDGYNGWDTLAAKIGTAQNAMAMTTVIGTELHNVTDTSYKQFTGTFTVPSNGIYNIGIYCNSDFTPEFLSIDDINLVQLLPCTGTPISGTTTASADSTCTTVDLATTGSSPAAQGLTYQWQSSPNGTTWTNIAGATSAYYTATLTASTYYRLELTCGGQTSSSTPKFVKLNAAVYCYCNSGLGGGCSSTSGAIDSVAISGTTLHNGPTGCAPGYYTQYPSSGNTTATLAPGTTYTFNVKFTGTSIGSVWVDYNQNGTFEANSTEYKQICLSSTPALNYTVALHVPSNAVLGNTIMRVRARDAGNTNDSTSGCLSFGSGETEDYIVTIGTPLGINSYRTFSGNLEVYPNPSAGKVNLHYTNAQNETISLSVLNVNGQLMYTEQVSNKGEVTKTIDLSTYTNGVYFIRLVSGNEVVIRKVVIQQ